MTTNSATIGDNRYSPSKDRPTLDDIFLEQAYDRLCGYELGIRKRTGELLIRPVEARLVLSNLRFSKPEIKRMLDELEERGLVEQRNQFLVILNKKKSW